MANEKTQQHSYVAINPINAAHQCKHTTLFQRPSDVHNGQMTLKRRQNNVLCYQGESAWFKATYIHTVSVYFDRNNQLLQLWSISMGEAITQ